MFAAHSAVILKAESMADKVEWMKKIKGVIQSKGGSVKGPNTPEDGSMRHSRSDGSIVSSS
jgi:dynamin GTPase